MQTISFREVVAELVPIYQAKSKATWVDFDVATRVHLTPFFGEKPIGQCAALWRHYCAHERKLNPLRKLWHDRKTMRVILSYAHDCGYIDKIPKLKLDPYDKSRREGKAVSREELELLCQNASPTLSDLMKVLFYTGMRFSEARNLRTCQVDFQTGFVRLSPLDTKTRRGRTYPLPAPAAAILQDRLKRHRSPWFFPNRERTGPISRSQKTFQIARKRAGLNLNLHDLRRGFISEAVRAGMSLDLCGKLVGASPQVLRDVYLITSEQDWQKVHRKFSEEAQQAG